MPPSPPTRAARTARWAPSGRTGALDLHRVASASPGPAGSPPATTHTAYAIQGNILTGPEVVEAMEAGLARHAPVGRSTTASWRRCSPGTPPAATRADGRVRRSSRSPRVPATTGCGVLADLRVDDHPDAPRELARLHDLSTLLFGGPRTSSR